MIIIWVVDTTHSFPFYSNFSKWSLYLEKSVENKVFYRIGEAVVKFYSAVLFALGFTLLIYMMCCGIMNYEDDSSEDDSGEDNFAEDYFQEEDKKRTRHYRVMSTPASISSQL
tara:strand:+ start:2196 stop:2534 length:339 start_codon:yes stop_codon:yes gene_type:complete